MFNETVAQKPTVPFRAGIKNFKKSGKVVNREGTENMGPKPPAARYAHTNRSNPTPNKIGALMPCRIRMYSIPFSTTARLISQNRKKQTAGP